MFSLRNFVKKGLLDAIGKLPDYQIILNATGWFEKGVLTESDLKEFDDIFSKRYKFAKFNAPETEEPDSELPET